MIYLLCLLTLAAVVALFFAAARAGYRGFGAKQLVLRAVVALPLLTSGSIHMVAPAAMAPAIPPVFPARVALVLFTGLCELAGAIGLFLPRWRRAAALCVALLMIAVFPANIHIAGQTVHGIAMPRVPARLAMQEGYILLVLAAGWGVPRLRNGQRSERHPGSGSNSSGPSSGGNSAGRR